MGDEVAPDELVIRRYDPTNTNMWRDEPGEPPRLKSGAIQFRPDGCSVYREDLLAQAQIERGALLNRPEQALAGAHVTDVTAIAAGEDHLVVVVDPWPNGKNTTTPQDEAHALIKTPDGVSNKRRDALASKLAARLRPIGLVR